MAGNYNNVMKKPWKGQKPPALESFPSMESSDSGPPALVSSSMSFRHLLSRPLVEAPCDSSYPPSISAISVAPVISHRPISVHVFTEDARDYGSHARHGMSADGGCVREAHATFQCDGGSDGASDVFAFSAQRKSSQPMIDINHPPSALYDSTSQSLCNACGIRFNKIRSGKRKASPQEAAMLREYDSADPAFSKPLPQSPVHKARSRLPRPRAGLIVYAPSSCCEGLPSAATSSNSDCGSPVGEGPEEGEVCDEPMHVGKKVCLRHEEQQLGNKVDEDDVVLGAELLVSLFGSCPV
ncbi:unnamed protein product [Closterium sp. NIES-65]|nr:unnamed protein product [Closterium sp. NIES-65]